MELLGSSVVLYLLVGVAVAMAMYVSDQRRGPGSRLFLVLTALPFWPLYLPLLLSGAGSSLASADGDDLTARIGQASSELTAALRDGRPEPSEEEVRRLAALRGLWEARADRVRELDRLLRELEVAEGNTPSEATTLRSEAGERWRQSEQARRRNLDRLRQLRAHAHEGLLANLARTRELATLLHLAKFTNDAGRCDGEWLERLAAEAAALSEVPPDDASGPTMGITAEPRPWA